MVILKSLVLLRLKQEHSLFVASVMQNRELTVTFNS
jgi:hypothetical protein